MTANDQDSVRLQSSMLTTAERRLLVWMARRLPAWVTSDQLTVLALAAMAGAGVSYWLAATHRAGLVLVIVCLAINWFGDSLDGTLARVRQRQRPRFGYYVDHVIDAVGVLLLLGGLALSGYVTPVVAFALLAAYFLVMIEVSFASTVLKTFRLSFFKLGPTELRIALATANLVLLFNPTMTLLGRQWLVFDIIGTATTLGLVAAFVVSAARNTHALYLQDPLPPRRV